MRILLLLILEIVKITCFYEVRDYSSELLLLLLFLIINILLAGVIEQKYIIRNYVISHNSSSSKQNDFPESIDLEFLALNRTFKIRFYKSNSQKYSNSNVYKIGNNDDLTIHVPKNHQVIFNWI
jgi:hypothetical protein